MEKILGGHGPDNTGRRDFVIKGVLVIAAGSFFLSKAGQILADMQEAQDQVQANIDNSVPHPGVKIVKPDSQTEQDQIAVLYKINGEMQKLFRGVKYPSRLANISYTAFLTRQFLSQHVEDGKGIEASSFPDSYRGEGDTVVNPYASRGERQIYAWDWGKDIEGSNTFIKRRDESTGEEEVWAVKLPQDKESFQPYFWRINRTDAQGHTTWRVSFFVTTVGDKGALQRSEAFDGESFLKPPMIMTLDNPYARK